MGALTDRRFMDGDRYYLTPPKGLYMRVPDQLRKTVLFIGVIGDLPEPEWIATAYLVAVPDAVRTLQVGPRSRHGDVGVVTYPFTFLATARHVAEKLEGKDFALRVNRIDDTIAIIRGQSDTRWWYHPTERRYVDAALAMFFPDNFADLDIQTIHVEWFADEEAIQTAHLGAGDEVFIAGLFTKTTETTKNIPIVRIGNLAMLPGEKIPFKDGKLIDAYLVESRSIGGLSGSPVFIRQTVKMEGDANMAFSDSAGRRLPDNQIVEMSGLGRIYFLGSMIGHWDEPTGFSFPQHEAVNMGISPMVPAHKIKEILMQPELLDMVKKVNEEMAAKRHSNAVEDFATEKAAPFTKDDFEDALKKASRKITPKSKT
jgi:hypothetical protein